jgi:hypothetical protein
MARPFGSRCDKARAHASRGQPQDPHQSAIRSVRSRLRREIGSGRGLVTVPETHGPAEEAEVDFGEFQSLVDGETVTLWMFDLRLSHSGKAMHIAYGNQAQESFLDGDVRAFAALGGSRSG